MIRITAQRLVSLDSTLMLGLSAAGTSHAADASAPEAKVINNFNWSDYIAEDTNNNI